MHFNRIKATGVALLLLLTCTVPATGAAGVPTIKSVIQAFATAVEARDVAALERILHPEFTVIATRYPDAASTTVMTRADYLGAISAGHIGGEAFKVQVRDIRQTDQNATADVIFVGEGFDMHMTLLLTQGVDGGWTIINDFPIVKPK